MGYEKKQDMEEESLERNALKVIKKDETCNKAAKRVALIQRGVQQKVNLDDKFESVIKGKKDYMKEVQERQVRIHERRSTKDGLKDKVLK